MTNFHALELSIQTARSLRGCLTRLQARDPDLARQTRRALTSVALNLAEGRRRAGKDRCHHWRIALGSVEEVRTALRVAEALGYLDEPAVLGPCGLLDRLAAMIWRLRG
ncbi:MAG: four helix bundle protein [Planctomycetes bacterium]|nr:four helix bundle protein [Planctomycetota bacterium]